MSYPRQSYPIPRHGMPIPQQYNQPPPSYGYGQYPGQPNRAPYPTGSAQPPYPTGSAQPYASRPPPYPPVNNTPSTGSRGAAPYPNTSGTNSTPYPTPYPNTSAGSTPYPNPTSNTTPYPTSKNSSTPYPNTNSNSTPYPTSGANSTPYPTGGSSNQPPYPSTRNTPSSQIAGEVNAWVDKAIINLTALFKDASYSELDALVQNEDQLMEIVQSTEELKKLNEKREQLVQANKDHALSNISIEPEIDTLKKELIRLADEQNTLKEKYNDLQQNIGGKVSVDDLSAVLQAETAKVEHETDAMSQQFLDSGSAGDLDEFLEMYIEKRTKYQARKVKSEKMCQLMSNRAISPNPMNHLQSMPSPSRHTNYAGYGAGY